MEDQNLKAGAALIVKDFDLDSENFLGGHPVSVDLVISKLTAVVEHLLDQDFNKLLNILYRIDISEEKLKLALSQNAEQPAKVIAQMIFEREMQKVETRKKYSN